MHRPNILSLKNHVYDLGYFGFILTYNNCLTEEEIREFYSLLLTDVKQKRNSDYSILIRTLLKNKNVPKDIVIDIFKKSIVRKNSDKFSIWYACCIHKNMDKQLVINYISKKERENKIYKIVFDIKKILYDRLICGTDEDKFILYKNIEFFKSLIDK